MKTKTILYAWLGSIPNEDDPEDLRTDRQAEKFYTDLLRRIEAGDRARITLAEIQATLLLIAPFEGRYNQIVDIVNQYFDGRQP